MIESFDNTYLQKCTLIPYNKKITVPFCYTPDPIDGPTFIWSRSQSCTWTRDDQNKGPANNQCRYAVVITSQYFNFKDRNWTMTHVPLFPGKHILEMTNTTENFSEQAKKLGGTITRLQSATVHTSTLSTIEKTDLCCGSLGPGASCYDLTSGDLGSVNDRYFLGAAVAGTHFLAKIATFPSFNDIIVTEFNTPMESIQAAGSIDSIIIYVATALVLAYRFLIGLRKKGKDVEPSGDQNIAMSAFYDK